MNYQKIYSQIVDRAKNRVLSGYCEKHHIVPRCMGGDNSKDNLVKLTAREHLVCHILLAKLHGGKLWAALNRMTNFGEKNSKKYEIYRKQYSKSISGTGNPRSGAIPSKATRAAIGRGNKGKVRTEETRKKLSISGKKSTRSHSARLNYSKSKGGGFKFKVYKLIGNFERKVNIDKFNRTFIGEFQSMRGCSRALNIPHQGVSKCLRARRKTHCNGYVFVRLE